LFCSRGLLHDTVASLPLSVLSWRMLPIFILNDTTKGE
jgi:hypothetical protein